MRRFAVAAVLSGALVAAGRERQAVGDAPPTITQVAAVRSAPKSDKPATVVHLIEDLGSDDYSIRRRAEEQLLALGPEAFDQLKAAEASKDLEVASRAQYILQQMRVEWIRPADAAEIRLLLSRYGELSEEEKVARINQLGKVTQGRGLPALCRIARFETSSTVARQAALAVLKRNPSSRGGIPLDACRVELGPSQRGPVQWLQVYFEYQNHPRDAVDKWIEAIDAEKRLLEKQSPETDQSIVVGLAEWHLDFCNRLELVDETAAALERTVELVDDNSSPETHSRWLGWAVQWIISHKRWDVLEQFDKRHAEELRANRILLYYLATAMRQANREDEAGQLAEQAFRMPDKESRRTAIASLTASLGNVDWAEREYRRAIELAPIVSRESLTARTDLAQWLADREDYKGAAEVLGELADALDADKPAKGQFIERLRRRGEDGREAVNAACARRELYLAQHYAAQNDHATERKHLEIAAALNERDPDILIAMYHSPGADDKFKADTMIRVRRVTKYQQSLVDEFPDQPSFYNQWSWLVANTEGDYARAVEYSKKSLQLQPGEASFLDTLGRCYYSAGDLKRAIRSQRKAVELAPQYQVMKRQLAIFEKELEAKTASGKSSGGETVPSQPSAEADG